MLNATHQWAIAIVMPMLNEQAIIAETVAAIDQSMTRLDIDYCIVCVDDGSSDETWPLIKAMSEKRNNLVGVRLSRNFGHDAAVFSGLRAVDAEASVTLDCDGQHPFEVIPELIRIWRETGCNIVNGVKRARGSESQFYRASVRTFGRLLSWTMNAEMNNASEFKLLDRKAVRALLHCGDSHIFYRALVPWIGFSQESLEFDVAAGLRSERHWSFSSLLNFAFSGLVMFSDLPFRIILGLGLGALGLCVLLFGKLMVTYFMGSVAVGYSTILTLLLLNTSFMMIGMGMLGLYMRATLNQAIARPRAIIQEVAGVSVSADVQNGFML